MRPKIKQKPFVLIFTLVLMAFVAQELHSQFLRVPDPNFDLAWRMHNKYKAVLTRDDLRPLLPEVLPAFKDPKFKDPDFYTPVFFTPTLLLNHLFHIDRGVLDKFITLLDRVPQIKQMFLAYEFAQLYGNAAAIDALLALLGPSNQVKIDHVITDTSPYGTVAIAGSYFVGEYARGGSTYTLTFTITDANQNPVPGLPLNLRLQPVNNTAATAVFDPAAGTTNQEGKLQTQITFGQESGDLRLTVEVDRQQIVNFVEFELERGDTKVDKVVLKNPKYPFARPGTTQTLVFTAVDVNGLPVQGEELTFGARSAFGSTATATFSPAVVTTNQNGEARTLATFGSEPGDIHLTVQSGAIKLVNITAIQMELGGSLNGALTGLQVGDAVDVGSTHTLVFTVKDQKGKRVSGVPIAFSGAPLAAIALGEVPLVATFDPLNAITDRNGEARTKITFEPEPGDCQIHISLDPQLAIVFAEPELRLGATNIANLKIQGMEDGFAQPGSSRTLTFTATDARGRPVAGQELMLGGGLIPDSLALIESFQPLTVKTNKNGKANTRVTFGPDPGVIRLTVKYGMFLRHVFFDSAPYATLKVGGLKIGDTVKGNATHKLIFTATDQNNKPLPDLPLFLDTMAIDYFSENEIIATTSVADFSTTHRVVTNKKGKVHTNVTFGDFHSDIMLYATVDQKRIVAFPNLDPNPKITLNNSQINRVTVEGMAHGFARVGTTHPLVLTALKRNGAPVKGAKFTLGFRRPPESNATATFVPATVTTDPKGQARTEVTFGPNSGTVRFAIQPPSAKITIDAVRADFNLPLLGDGALMYEGVKIGDRFDIDATRNLIFTATKADGDVVPWLPLRFEAVYVDGTPTETTFTPVQAVTNKKGKARTRIAFGGEPGNIRLIAEVDREQIVVFSEPDITLNNSGIDQLAIKGIDQGFARVGTKRTLVFTATDATGAPVADANLVFGFESPAGSEATATFASATATTDSKGQARTDVTFGPNGGDIAINVSVQAASFFYWISGTDIMSANRDGSNWRSLLNRPNIPNIDSGLALDPERKHIYWVEYNAGRSSIKRANLDGSNPQNILTDVGGQPSGFALDVLGNKIYWCDSRPFSSALIQRANLDGSNVENILIEESDEVWNFVSLTVDPVRRKIYWVRNSGVNFPKFSKIQRTNLDGSNLETVINPHIFAVEKQGANIPGIALDVERGQIYWLEDKGNSIYSLRRANLDGANIQDLNEIEMAVYPQAFALDSADGKIYWTTDDLYSADLNGNITDTIVPYRERNDGARSGTRLSLISRFALNTKIDPASVVSPTRPRNVWIRNSRFTVIPSSPDTLDIDMKFDADGLSGGFLPGSKHKLTFTFTRNSGEPLSGNALVKALHAIGYTPSLTTEPDGEGEPLLQLAINPRSSTTATFSPATITPDENGTAETYVTFGPNGGVIDIDVNLPIVAFQTIITDITLRDVDADQKVEWQIVSGQSIAGQSQKFRFTAKDATGKPLSGYHLILGIHIIDPNSSTRATFNPATLNIDENGEAETEVTYGRIPGPLTIYVTLKPPESILITELIYSEEPGVDIEIGIDTNNDGVYEAMDAFPFDFTPMFSPEAESVDIPMQFVVKKEGEIVRDADISVNLIRTDSPRFVTFRPASFGFDLQQGKATTTLTLKKGLKEFYIYLKVSRSVFISSYTAGVGGYDYEISYNMVGSDGELVPVLQSGFAFGSKHKLILTVRGKDGEAIPSIELILSARSVLRTAAATATFEPSGVTTDKNGQVETYIIFGNKPGMIGINVDIPLPREAVFQVNNAGIQIGSNRDKIEIDVTIDGESGKIWKETSYAGYVFRYPLSRFEAQTKKVILKARSYAGESVPFMDIELDSFPKGIVTFKPNKVRTDRNGQAVTEITFGAGQESVDIYVRVNMAHIEFYLTPDPDFVTPGATLNDDVGHMSDVGIYVDGKLVSDYLLGEISAYRLGQTSVTSAKEITAFEGILPLNAEVYVQFKVSSTASPSEYTPYALYDIHTRQRSGTDIKFDRDYATSDANGVVKIGMNTVSESGSAEITLKPLTSAQLQGSARTVIKDDDSPLADSFYSNAVELPPINITSQQEFKYRYAWKDGKEDTTIFGPHDGIRVEIEIRTGRILSTGVEIGAFVKLYEGESFNDNDLEDVSCQVFVIPWTHTSAYVFRQLSVPRTTEDYISRRVGTRLINPTTLPDLRVYNISNEALGRQGFFRDNFGTLAAYIGIDPDWVDRITPDRWGGDEAMIILGIELAPINWTPVFGAPAAETANVFSFSDVNVDGQVNVTDLILVSNALEQTYLVNLRVDVNNDGIFTIADLIQVAQHLGQSIGSDTSASLIVPDELAYVTVEEWIDHARAADDGSLVFRQGIANLEFLLTLIAPEKTKLLTNYPNPFNPETWIPYHLAEPSNVTLTIYAIDGKIVRKLDLGHQAAGYYQRKSRAAYWDGRNSVGERVASGVYFYTLTAGEFTATRKLLIRK